MRRVCSYWLFEIAPIDIDRARWRWWFKCIYEIIRPLALTQRNNGDPSLKLRAIVSSGIQSPLLNLFRHPRQIVVPNLARLPITHIRCQLAVGVVLATCKRLIVPARALTRRRRHRARVTAIQLRSRNRSRHGRGCPERAEIS